MARSGFRSVVLFCVTVGAVGCSKSTSPSPSRALPTPAAKTAADASRPAQPQVAKSGQGGMSSPKAPDVPPSPALVVSPASASLDPGDQGLQLMARESDKRGQHDLTTQVAWSVEPAGVVAVEINGYLKPLAPGRAKVQARLKDAVASAEVTVGPSAARPWDFGEDIVPILTRSGCNTGGCHGRADGQNGFHLSLFGYDAQGDYRSITRDAAGRRISRLAPEQSLFLQKATGSAPHGGGLRITRQSPEYQTLRDWITDGAPMTLGKTHGELVRLEVEPADIRLGEPGPQQIRATAHYADGHRRDVTRLATFRVNDDSAATIDARGKAVLLRRAETDLIVRYQSQVVSTRLATLINPDLAYDFANRPRRNFIDDELFKRLESLKVPPSPRSSDTAFFRRVSLDLVGRQPTPEQVRQFLASDDPDKRVKLVDRLLADRDFVRFWRIKFGDMLQISSTRQGNGASKFQDWVDTCLRDNTHWDVMVRTLLTAVGAPEEYGNGAANYALDGPDAKTQAEQSAQRFLALRMRCAQCHDHPFDVWTQDDYFGLAAFFAKVQRTGGAGMMGRTVIKVNPKGQVEHLRTKAPASPRLPNRQAVAVAEKDDPRKALADWVTSPENPYFARAMANWTWAQFFGKGLADPPDDLSRANPPVHPELLDALAKHFVASKYDIRDLIRTITTSEAYGLSSGTIPGNERDERLFSHQMARPLSAHQMADVLAQATDVVNQYPNRALGTRAIDVADPSTASSILDTFGRCPRAIGCSSVATPSLSLRQSLLLIGGDTIEGKVSHLNGYLANLLELSPEPGEIVENLYYRTVCRPPTAEELSHWTAELKQSTTPRETAEDLFWALLNSREFAFNH